MESTVRRATRDDVATIERYWLAFLNEQSGLDSRLKAAEDAAVRFRNDYPAWLRSDSRRVFVVTSGGEIEGFATAQLYHPAPVYAPGVEVHLDEVYIRPESRQGRAGSLLVQAVKDWASEINARRIRLNVLATNKAGLGFWAEQGSRVFSEVHTIELDGSREGEDRFDPDRPLRSRLGFG